MTQSLLHNELIQAFKRLDLAFYLAWSDTRTRYERSVLGPFWLVLGTAIGVGGLGYVWSILFNVDRATFIPNLATGLVAWYFISGCIVESTSTFYTQRDLILNIPFSSLMLSILLLLRHMVNFGHNFIVIIGILIIYPSNLTPHTLLFIPGFFLVCLNLLWIIHVFGYFGARYRDLNPLVNAVMPLIFFITPVLFRANQLGSHAFIAYLNPLAFLLKLIRDPLTGNAPPLMVWVASSLMACLGWTAALWVTHHKRHRLTYWVH
jgi:ABC-type polysaccharide/polyol phosphate export permease